MNTKKNIALQTTYQVVNTVFPLITAPYLSRVLGPNALGVFSYTQSIVGLFSMVAMLGITTFGVRTIASKGENKSERSNSFWSIYCFQFISCAFSLVLYLFYLKFLCSDNRLIAFIQSIEIVSCLLNISWFYFGVEKFEITVSWSIAIRIVTVLMILFLVKDEDDLWIYTMIMCIGTCLGYGVLWIHLPRYVSFLRVNYKDIFANTRSILLLFIPIAAMSVYHIMDKTMLGIFSTYEQTGYYYNSDKVINIPVGVIGGIGTVLLPRISALIGEGKKDEADKLFNMSLEGTIFVCSAIAFGIAAIAHEFVPLFFGLGYESCILLIYIFTPVLIIKGYAFTVRYQFLIPWGKEKVYIVSILGGAVTNLIVNIILIPQYGAIGAAIGTVVAELLACVLQYILVRKYIEFKESLLFSFGFLVVGGLMLICVRNVSKYLDGSVISLIFEIVFGALVYLSLSLVYLILTHRIEEVKEIMRNTKIGMLLARRGK